MMLDDAPIQADFVASDVGDEEVLPLLLQNRAQAFANLKAKVLADLGSEDVEIKNSFDHMPVIHLQLKSLHALEALAAYDEVLQFYKNEKHQMLDDLTLINQPQTFAAGKGGAGTAVAVLDTGTDYTRAAFGSCTSAGPSCKVVYAHDFAPDDGNVDDNGHGSNVAGIVLNVAPSTKIIALDVFNGSSAWSSDIISAVNFLIDAKTNSANPVHAYKTTTQGLKTVSVWFRDQYGNATTSPATATVTLDTVAAHVGSLLVAPGSGQIALSWSGFTDSNGIASYRLVGSATSTPGSCITGGVIYSGTATNFTQTSLVNGKNYYYRLCAYDSAGNISAGVTATARPVGTLATH